MRRHMDGQFEGLADRLERVEAQVSRTNGRVTELEAVRRETLAVEAARALDSTGRRLTRAELMQLAGVVVAIETAVIAAVKFL
jgi:hypothetical protein